MQHVQPESDWMTGNLELCYTPAAIEMTDDNTSAPWSWLYPMSDVIIHLPRFCDLLPNEHKKKV